MACIILASGLSERFGSADKLAANLCGKPVLAHVVDIAQDVGFGEIFCVSRLNKIDGVTLIKNDDPEFGQGHALRLGLDAARKSGWDGCAVMLGDMPLVDAAYVKKMTLKTNINQCVVSVNKSIRMPPAAFNSAAIDLILAQTSPLGARELFDKLNPATVQLEADTAQDIDTPEDLIRVARIMEARKK